MQTQQTVLESLGRLAASVVEKDGSLALEVSGIFPTNGEKPRFSFEMNVPQGINPTILLLTLVFGELVQENGTSSTTVYGSFEVENRTQYTSVQVVDSRSRTLATATVV